MKITPDTHLKPRWTALFWGLFLAITAPVLAQDAAAPGSSASPLNNVSPFTLPSPESVTTPSTEAQPIVEEISIRIINSPLQISREAVLAHVLLREKMAYNQELVDKSINALIDTGLFSHVESRREALPTGGVRLILSLIPKDRVSAVVFEGNKEYSRERLSNEIKTTAGNVLDPAQVKHDRDSLFDFYQKKGYTKVKIEPDIATNENTGTAVVTFKIDEGPDVIIKQIKFVGNDHISASTLKDQMTTLEYEHFFTFSRLPSWITGTGRFKEDDFQDDLDKLRQYYKKEGYLDVNIPDDQVEYTYPNSPGDLVIVIHIQEGRQYHIGKITVSGNTIFQSDTLLKQPTFKLKPGDVFSPPAVDDAVSAVRDFYGQSGYLDTFVRPERQPNLDTGNIDLNLAIIESEKYYVEGIDIQGNTKTKSTVIVRELALAPGDVFDTVRMKTSENRLKQLGYFNDEQGRSEVNLAPEESNIPGKRDLSINVKEGKTGFINFGGGFDSVEGVVAFISFTQSNFDLFNYRNYFQGGGQQAKVSFSIGDQLSSINLSFDEPWLWERELDGGIDLFRTETSYYSTTYNETDTGFDVHLRKHLFNLYDPLYKSDASVDGTLTYTLDNIQISDVTANATPQIVAEQGYTTISKVGLDLQRTDLDNFLTPTKGSRYELINEVAGGPFGGQSDYYLLEAHAGWWLPIESAGNQTVSLVTRAGSITGYGGKDVLYAEKYFLGGESNMRGYSYRNVGPHYPNAGTPYDGEPVGGNSFVYASPEYSIELFNPVRFAVFYDFGYVNEGSFDFDPSGFQQDVGFGFRIFLLGAPMRIDIGYPLNPNQFQSHSFQFNFSFGAVF